MEQYSATEVVLLLNKVEIKLYPDSSYKKNLFSTLFNNKTTSVAMNDVHIPLTLFQPYLTTKQPQ